MPPQSNAIHSDIIKSISFSHLGLLVPKRSHSKLNIGSDKERHKNLG